MSCPWLTPEDLELIGDIGLPNPFHWDQTYKWAIKILERFAGKTQADLRLIRQRFIRFRCVDCKEVCKEDNNDNGPIALPCGHIMDWRCYRNLSFDMVAGFHNRRCPWDGVHPESPVRREPPCYQFMVYDCAHPRIYAQIPGLYADFSISPKFFIPINGYMTDSCLRCTVQELLQRWTRDARALNGDPSALAICSGFSGALEGDGDIFTYYYEVAPGLEKYAEYCQRVLRDLFHVTPIPLDDGQGELNSKVVFLTRPSH